MLSTSVQSYFSEINSSTYELLELKDKFILQYFPANVSLRIILVLSRFCRVYSQSRPPIYELVRFAQLHSESFNMKSIRYKISYDHNETTNRTLNMAIQKLASMQWKTKQRSIKSKDPLIIGGKCTVIRPTWIELDKHFVLGIFVSHYQDQVYANGNSV